MILEPTPDAELASAALDNEVIDADRARLRASNELSAEYAVYQELSGRISAVEVSNDIRERSLAAAMSVFDDLHVTSPSQAGRDAPVVSITTHRDRRQQYYRWLGAAAAVSIFAVGGMVLLNGGSSEDKASTALDSQAAPSAKLVPGTNAAVPDAEATFSTALTASDQAASTDAAAPAPAAGAEPPASVGLASVEGPADVAAWALAPSLSSEAELVAYITALQSNRATAPAATEAAPATDAPGASSFACVAPAGYSVAVIYLGREVYAVRDDLAPIIYIFDPVTCGVEQIAVP